MDRSKPQDELSAEEMAQQLGAILTDDEMENVAGGLAEFIQIRSIPLE